MNFKASPRHDDEASHTENTTAEEPADEYSLNKQFWATLEGNIVLVDRRHCRKTFVKVLETSIEKCWLDLITKGQEEAVQCVPERHRNEMLTTQIQTEQNDKINRTGRRNRGDKCSE